MYLLLFTFTNFQDNGVYCFAIINIANIAIIYCKRAPWALTPAEYQRKEALSTSRECTDLNVGNNVCIYIYYLQSDFKFSTLLNSF